MMDRLFRHCRTSDGWSDLMEILCCPVCKGDLELRVDVEKDEIIEGSLFCKKCNHRYEIKDGIPDLLPPDFK